MARPKFGPTPFPDLSSRGTSVWHCRACRNRRDPRYLRGQSAHSRGYLPRIQEPERAMTDHDLFFSRTGMDRARVQQTVDEALKGADDGELYLEYSQSESFSFDDNRLKAAAFDTSQGFGLRAVAGEATGYAHASDISESAIARAAATVRAVSHGYSGVAAPSPARTNIKLYTDIDPLETAGFEKKVKLLEEMNAYARGLDSRVRQVSASLSGEWQRIEIVRAGGEQYSDVRPLVRLNVSVVVEENGRQESGSFGGGGR